MFRFTMAIGFMSVAMIMFQTPRTVHADRFDEMIERIKVELEEVHKEMARLKKAARLDEDAREELNDLQNHQKELHMKLKRVFEARKEAHQRDWRRERRRERREQETILNVELNARDAAHFDAARLLCKAEEYADAIAELENVTKDSPDEHAVNAAQFSIANIFRRNLGEPDKAVAHYAKVKGELRGRALDEMIATFEEVGEVDKAVQHINSLIEAEEDKAVKVRLLNDLAELLQRNGDDKQAIATFRRIPKVVTYEEAEKMREKPEHEEDEEEEEW